MEHFEDTHQRIVERNAQGFSPRRTAHRMGLSVELIQAHLELERLRQAAASGPESPQQEQERLIAAARAYLLLLPAREQQLQRIRSYASRGLLRPETLELREREFAALVALQENEAALQQGIALLGQRGAETEPANAD